MINREDIWKQCREKAETLIKNVAHEDDLSHQYKIHNDPSYRGTINHIAQMYLEFATNECFKQKRIEEEIQHQKLLMQIQNSPILNHIKGIEE